MTMKVMTIVGTRPELIKLCRVIREMDRATIHVLVHTGQNYDYELNGIFFEELGVRRPNHFLEAAGSSPAATIANVIARSDEIMAQEQPDALLILGDTNSCLSALSAKRRKIPVFHMEAGNRCFDERVPEEINRRVVDHLSDINMPYTEHGRRYLLAEGIKPETVIKTGSPMKEVLAAYSLGIDSSGVLGRLGVEERGYFVISAHREENIEDDLRFSRLVAAMKALEARYGKPIIVSTHPRTRKRLEVSGVDLGVGINLLRPLGFFDYVKLQKHAFCVLSDSGTITEESSLLDFPAVTIREAHERPEGMDEGTLVMSGLEAEKIIASVDLVTSQHSRTERRFRLVPDYDVDNVSQKVVRIVLSYTDYVNRTVWQK